jgi:hypothetical protein
MNSYIQPNFATAEAAAADIAAAADASVATAAASASGVTIEDDAEGDITVKAVELGEKKSDVVEASSPAVASAMVAVASTVSVASAAAVASGAAVAVPAVASVKKWGEWIAVVCCMSSYIV